MLHRYYSAWDRYRATTPWWLMIVHGVGLLACSAMVLVVVWVNPA